MGKKVKKPARPSQSPFVFTRRKCLGFGAPHEFLSTSPGHRRCAACDKKLSHLHVSQSCEVPHKAYED